MGIKDERPINTSNVISENTPVRVGMIIAFLGVFASAVWWGSMVTTKLDYLITFQSNTTISLVELKAKDTSLEKELSDLKLRIALTEASTKIIDEKISSHSKATP